MFYRLGELVSARARLVLTLTLVALAAFAVLGVGVFGRLLSGGFDDPSSASSRAKTLIDQRFGGDPNLILLVHARAGSVDGPRATASGEALTKRLAADPRLRGVTDYWTTHAPGLRSRDGTDALILATVVGDDTQAGKNATALLADYRRLDDAAVTVRIGGQQGADVGGQVGKDLALAEGIAVPLTLILLVVAFGSVVSALLPLAVAVIAIFGALAELSLLTHVTSVSIFAINLATALGLGLGIDYALLMVSRFREELTSGADVATAVARTTASAGRTITFSALTVAAALAAMLVFPVYFLKSFAYAGVGVTLLSAAAALLFLPAILAVLGERVNAGRVPKIRPNRAEAPFWGRLATAVMRRPAIAAVPVIAVLLLLATPLLDVTFGTPDDRVLPTSAASHQVGDALRGKFATGPGTVEVLLSPRVAPAKLQSYADELGAMAGVDRVSTSQSADAQRLRLTTGPDFASDTTQSFVRHVRAAIHPSGTTVLVGGSTAQLVDAKHAISSRLPLAAGLIVVTTFVVLFLFTGSVVQPVRALLGNAFTLGGTLGAMVLIFQDGHLSSLLGFTAKPIDTSMPVLLFCIAFGVSMDYEVFLMSRIRELHDAGSTNADAVVHGLARTGRIVSTAAALLAVTFFAFGTSSVSFIQLFGLGTGLAILLDATLVRGVLVPAFMGVFGEGSWYAPPGLRRLHRRLGLSD